MPNYTKQEQLKKISVETMRFLRGKYALDEVGNGKDELKLQCGRKTILTIYIRDDRYDFLIIFGKAECSVFEAQREEFPQKFLSIYDDSKTYRAGKRLMIPVADLETLDAVKKMILIKKKPNRKPFSKTHIHISNCGHRCDLCIHNKGKTSFSSEEMEYARACISSVYTVSISDLPINCNGCHFPDCTAESANCRKGKGLDKCWACENYSSCLKTAGWPPEIHTRTITADQVTFAILPYVKGQYGN